MFAFVLPTETATHPGIGPAVATACFVNSSLKRVPSAFGISGSRLGLAKQLADVEEVLLASTSLRERYGLPLLDELLWRQGNNIESDRKIRSCPAAKAT